MSTLNLWQQDPFADVEQLVRTVFGNQPERPQGWTPASEIFRDGDDAVVQVDVPGLDIGNDVTVEIDRSHLVIRGERRQQSDAQAQHSTVRERRYGSFRRVFRLPEHVKPSDLVASYDAGVLTVRVKGAYAPPQPVKVTIGVGDSTGEPDRTIDASSMPGAAADTKPTDGDLASAGATA